MMEGNDEAAIELLESLERQIGHVAPPFADVEELRKRRCDHLTGCFIKNETAGHDGELIPAVVVDAAWRVDEQLQSGCGVDTTMHEAKPSGTL